MTCGRRLYYKKREMTPFKRKSPYVQVLFDDFWTVVQNDTSWSEPQRKEEEEKKPKVKECVFDVWNKL